MITLNPDGLALPLWQRSDWNAAPRRRSPRYTQTRRKLVLHHGTGRTPTTLLQSFDTVSSYQSFHQNHRGWSDLAYNFAAIPTEFGAIEGRGFFYQNGANTPENATSFSIVLLGDTNRREMTDHEKRTVLALQSYLNLPVEACPGGCGLAGHRDVSATTCPGESAYQWILDGAPSPDDSHPGC